VSEFVEKGKSKGEAIKGLMKQYPDMKEGYAKAIVYRHMKGYTWGIKKPVSEVIEKVVEKTGHNPALRYHIVERGFIREGYYADLVLLNPNATTSVANQHSRYLCGWTPVADQQFSARIVSTWVNGQQVFNGYHILEATRAAMPLLFNR
ncbi:hypothetical protein LCGC14_2615860, partial [marine sediment metagenome]